LLGFFRKYRSEERNLYSSIRGIIGKRPRNFELYKLALRHSSVSDQSNERLEFLGDAILDAVIADYLFKKFPFKNEGFLTELRSRLVKRETLNALAEKIGLRRLLQIQPNSSGISVSVYGNALEAFVGAIYLDRGFDFSYDFIINRLIRPYLVLQDVIDTNRNFKSALIEWAQKNTKHLEFKILNHDEDIKSKSFKCEVFVNYESVGKGAGSSKKKAEQSAAEKACIALEINKYLE
jgi:ribonuclease III